MGQKAAVTIHDAVHGGIALGRHELSLLDSRPLQRLRSIKQLGFAELAFPGATHSRFSHSLGAMQMATRMVDKVLATLPLTLPRIEARRLRQAVRLASLFHDLGHPPLSHVSERIMPKLSALALPAHVLAGDDPDRQASHEDYTLKLLYDSELTPLLARAVGDLGVTPDLLASLIAGRHLGAKSSFVLDGIDLLPLLTAITSSELDADRMDYLRRDAYACGVSYGNFDHMWLCNNLTCVTVDGQVSLGLLHKAVWAFENYLLARYHMFLAVYYHHTSICFDHLLGCYFAEGEYKLPADSDSYLGYDDVHLMYAMRHSKSPWAKAVIGRRPWKMLVESHDFAEAGRAGSPARDGDGWPVAAAGPAAPSAAQQEITRSAAALRAAGIDSFVAKSGGMLSKYFGPKGVALKILEPERNRVHAVDAYTPLYRRFSGQVSLMRLYCPHEQAAAAQGALALHA